MTPDNWINKDEQQTWVVRTKLTKFNENYIEKLQKWLEIKSLEDLKLFLKKYNAAFNNWTQIFTKKWGIPKEIMLILLSYKASIWDIGDTDRERFTINFPIIIKLKKVYTQDSFYIFEDEKWSFFHADIVGFNEKWILSESFKVWKPDLGIWKVVWFTIDNTWNSINLIKDDKIISALVWELATIVDSAKWDLVIVNDNLIEYIKIKENWKYDIVWDSIQHPYWAIEKLNIDKHGNFLLFISKYDEKKYKLHIVNRKTLEEIENYEDIIDIVQVDNKNDLTCLDVDWKLVSITTNFDQFEKWFVDTWTIWRKRVVEVKDVALSQLEALLSNWWLEIDLDQLATKEKNWKSNNHHNNDLVSKIWEIKVWEKTLKELFDEADSEDKINLVANAFLQIKSNPAISWVSWITQEIESDINQKTSEIKLKSLLDAFNEIKDIFEINKPKAEQKPYAYFQILMNSKSRIEMLKKNRSQVFLTDDKLDKDISDLDDEIEAWIISFQLKNADEIIKKIDDNFQKLTDFVNSINYLSNITQVYSNKLYTDIERYLNYIDDDKKINYNKKLSELISNRIVFIQDQEKVLEKKETENLKKQVASIENSIANLAKIIDSLEEESTLDTFKTNDNLILRIKQDIEVLPKSESERLSLALESIFSLKKQNIRLKKLDTKWIVHSLDEYWIDTSLYYTDKLNKQIWFKLVWNRLADWNLRLEIHYDDWTIFNIDSFLQDSETYAESIIFTDFETEVSTSDFINLQKNISSWKSVWKQRLSELRLKFRDSKGQTEKENIWEEIKSIKEKYKKARAFEHISTNLSNKLNLNPRSRVELPNPSFIVIDEDKEILNSMSNWFDIQKEQQKWIDILEWPPWLWKTEICKFFASITNREIIRVQCSKMDPSDLFFAPKLKSWETTREPAEWIKYMQKPWTMILFDEIDKLNPQSFERLHSLFDWSRSVYDPQLWSVKASNDCLFVWTCNQYDKMSNPIVSRSSIIEIKAPSELNEAFKISKYSNLEYFEKLDYTEFTRLFSENSSSTDVNTRKIFESLDNIKRLVKLFNELRLKQRLDSEKFEYEISYRDAGGIFAIYNRSKDISFKEVVLKYLSPKVKKVVLDTEDKVLQEEILRKAINSCF